MTKILSSRTQNSVLRVAHTINGKVVCSDENGEVHMYSTEIMPDARPGQTYFATTILSLHDETPQRTTPRPASPPDKVAKLVKFCEGGLPENTENAFRLMYGAGGTVNASQVKGYTAPHFMLTGLSITLAKRKLGIDKSDIVVRERDGTSDKFVLTPEFMVAYGQYLDNLVGATA